MIRPGVHEFAAAIRRDLVSPGAWLLIGIAALCFSSPLQAQRDDVNVLPHPVMDHQQKLVREQLEAAREELDRALETEGVSDEVLAQQFGRVGRLYFLYDLNDLAPLAFRNAIALAPESPEWRYLLAAHQMFEGETEEAEGLLRWIVERRPGDLPTRVRFGDLLLDSGRADEALVHYTKALELDGDSAAALYGLGRIDRLRGDHEAAVVKLERAVSLQPAADAIYHPLALSYRKLGDTAKARELISLNKHGRVTFPDPLINRLGLENQSADGSFHAAAQAMRRGEMEEAARLYRQFLEAEPDDPIAHHNLGVSLLASGEWEDGIGALRRSIEINPDYRGGHFSLGSALAEEGRFEEAMFNYSKAHEIDPEDGGIHADWATLLAKTGEPRRAVEEFEVLLARDPEEVYIRLKYASVLALVGEVDRARAILTPLVEASGVDDRNKAEAWYVLGSLDERQGSAATARASYMKASELDSRSAEYFGALAKLLGQSEDFEAAAAAYEKGLALPGGAQLGMGFGRAMALMLGGQDMAARRQFEETLATRPELAVQHALARLLATSDDPDVRDGAMAVQMAEKVVQERLTLDHAETLAMALAEAGRSEEAVDWQERILNRARSAGQASGPEHDRRLRRLELYRSGNAERTPWRSTP